MLTHRNVVHSVLHYQACMRLVPGPLGTGGAGQPRHRAHRHHRGDAAGGGAIVVVPAFQAADFVRLVEGRAHQPHADGAGDVQPVPAQRHDGAARPEHWRVGGYGGAPMPVATIDALAARCRN